MERAVARPAKRPWNRAGKDAILWLGSLAPLHLDRSRECPSSICLSSVSAPTRSKISSTGRRRAGPSAPDRPSPMSPGWAPARGGAPGRRVALLGVQGPGPRPPADPGDGAARGRGRRAPLRPAPRSRRGPHPVAAAPPSSRAGATCAPRTRPAIWARGSRRSTCRPPCAWALSWRGRCEAPRRRAGAGARRRRPRRRHGISTGTRSGRSSAQPAAPRAISPACGRSSPPRSRRRSSSPSPWRRSRRPHPVPDLFDPGPGLPRQTRNAALIEITRSGPKGAAPSWTEYLVVTPEADGGSRIDDVLFATRRSDTLRAAAGLGELRRARRR